MTDALTFLSSQGEIGSQTSRENTETKKIVLCYIVEGKLQVKNEILGNYIFSMISPGGSIYALEMSCSGMVMISDEDISVLDASGVT